MQRLYRGYKRLKRQIVLFGLGHALIFIAQAQLPDIRFEHLGIEAGLSSNFVVSIAQDRFGYLWFGTNKGLNRYDGNAISTFWHDPADSTSLAFDWVEALLVDQAGDLWIGTHGGGLCRFDYATEGFVRFQHDPRDSTSLSDDIITILYEDSEQNFWVGTAQGGLNKFDRKTGTFHAYRYRESDLNSISDDNIRCIYEDQQGQLWIGTGGPFPTELGGLNRFNSQQGTFTRYLHDPQDEQTLIDNRVWELYEDREGRFWVGTFGDGLHLMDRNTGTFTRLPNNPSNEKPYSSPYLRRTDSTNPGFGPGITRIHQDHSDVLWISAVYGGLDRFDLKSGARQHFEADPGDPTSTGLNWVWTVYEDRQHILWLASAGNGVYKVLPGLFQHYQHNTKTLSINAVFEDQHRRIWVGTDQGLFNIDDATNSIIPIHSPIRALAQLGQASVHAIAQDSSGKIWFGTTNGLYQLDAAQSALKPYRHRPGDSNSLSHNNVLALASSATHTWLLSPDNTVHQYDPEADQFHRFSFLDSLALDQGENHSILGLHVDTKGCLWMGMDAAGAIRWDPGTEAVQFFPDLFPWALYYHTDREGRFWIGSRLEGLIQFDPEQGRILRKITEKEGLASGRINGILEDPSGTLWLSTQDGFLSRFDPESGNIKNYDHQDGLQRNHFLPGSFCQTADHRFLFGGLNGLTVFDPTAFSRNTHPPEVVINTLLANEDPIRVSGKNVIELSHNQNDLTFKFAALHYNRPEANEIRTMLDGYDTNWQTLEPFRAARYTNLDPGIYCFKVKAANSDGVWTSQANELHLILHPPWWQTWWAYTGTLLAILGALFAFFHYQKRRWKLKAALQLEQAESIRLKELDEFKSRFYTNVTHEFRTPLTVIQGLADQIQENPRWKTSERLQLIKRNSARLLQLINQLLDLSKLEAGKLKPHYIQSDIIPFLEYLVESFHSFAFSKKISLSFHPHTDHLIMDYDSEKCQQILTNLLANALKFTPEYGSVKVYTQSIHKEKDRSYLQVTVADTVPARVFRRQSFPICLSAFIRQILP